MFNRKNATVEESVVHYARVYGVPEHALRTKAIERNITFNPSGNVQYIAEDMMLRPVQRVAASAGKPMHDASLMQWAIAGGYPIADVMAFARAYTTPSEYPQYGLERFDWDAFFARFPITLPKDEDGNIIKYDIMSENWMVDTDDLQKALIYAQLSTINESIHGADDNWYDYLPAGIALLAAIQSEGWEDTMRDVWNNDNVFSRTETDEEQEFLESHDHLFIMDVTSPMILHFSIERDEDDHAIRR